jgi:hypothetical protein
MNLTNLRLVFRFIVAVAAVSVFMDMHYQTKIKAIKLESYNQGSTDAVALYHATILPQATENAFYKGQSDGLKRAKAMCGIVIKVEND